jgi:lysophospholipase L1-like esterase
VGFSAQTYGTPSSPMMCRMWGKLAALLAGMALLAGCTKAAPDTPIPGRGYQVAVIGDSFTTGSLQGGVGPNGWPTLVKKALDDQNLHLNIRTAAEGGAGYVEKGAYVGGVFADQVNDVVGIASDLVVFFGSANDGPAPLDALTAAVHDDFAKAKAYAPHAKLLVIGPVWPFPNPPDQILRVRDIVRDQALAAGAVFVDPLAEHWFADAPQLIGTDGTHPTDDGHKYLAQRIAPAIANALTRA